MTVLVLPVTAITNNPFGLLQRVQCNDSSQESEGSSYFWFQWWKNLILSMVTLVSKFNKNLT